MSEVLYYTLLWYLLAVNLLSFVIWGYDKSAAKRKNRRISEKTLFLITFLGGSGGSLTAMHLFRHKTKHWYFTVFIPLIFALHITLFIWWQLFL